LRDAFGSMQARRAEQGKSMTNDIFRTHSRGLTSPPEHAAAIAPDDAARLGHATRAVYVGSGGDLTVRMLGGSVVTLAGVAGGTLVPLRVMQVLASGTTAGAIVGLW
jgi:hypothetical protein